MNNQLIEKIITSNNLVCPELVFENALLDKNVSNALSKSFVKIYKLAKHNSNVNNNLRHSILQNIRKMCQIEPEDHLKINEHVTMLLTEVYEDKFIKLEIDDPEKNLDAFLIRNMKDMDINSNYKSTSKPDIVQALMNLKENSMLYDTLCEDIIHWDSTDNKNIHIMKELWMNDKNVTEDISIKLTSIIEKALLEICLKILTDSEPSILEIFSSNTSIKILIKRSSESPVTFQICCSILNNLFIKTNFNPKIQSFVQMFIEAVQNRCTLKSFSVLYPPHLSHIVVLLDIDIEVLSSSVKDEYIQTAVKYLLELQSENNLIMLLSHFPQWFDIYFCNKNNPR